MHIDREHGRLYDTSPTELERCVRRISVKSASFGSQIVGIGTQMAWGRLGRRALFQFVAGW